MVNFLNFLTNGRPVLGKFGISDVGLFRKYKLIRSSEQTGRIFRKSSNGSENALARQLALHDLKALPVRLERAAPMAKHVEKNELLRKLTIKEEALKKQEAQCQRQQSAMDELRTENQNLQTELEAKEGALAQHRKAGEQTVAKMMAERQSLTQQLAAREAKLQHQATELLQTIEPAQRKLADAHSSGLQQVGEAEEIQLRLQHRLTYVERSMLQEATAREELSEALDEMTNDRCFRQVFSSCAELACAHQG